jgi:hypothetical protein
MRTLDFAKKRNKYKENMGQRDRKQAHFSGFLCLGLPGDFTTSLTHCDSAMLHLGLAPKNYDGRIQVQLSNFHRLPGDRWICNRPAWHNCSKLSRMWILVCSIVVTPAGVGALSSQSATERVLDPRA